MMSETASAFPPPSRATLQSHASTSPETSLMAATGSSSFGGFLR